VADDTEFARFHVLDSGDLLEDLRWSGLIHGWNIFPRIHFSTKECPAKGICPTGVPRPGGRRLLECPFPTGGFVEGFHPALSL
jgi:hypothetical protein